MADVLDPLPIPAAMQSPLRAVLRGQPAPWPEDAGSEDAARFVESIQQHGAGPLLYSRLPDNSWPIHAALRDAAIRAAAMESLRLADLRSLLAAFAERGIRSEEHTSELQSLTNLVCRLLLEKKKKTLQTLQRVVYDMMTVCSSYAS